MIPLYRIWNSNENKYLKSIGSQHEFFVESGGNIVLVYQDGNFEYLSDFEIEKCSGLLDLNGNYIYEGDIIEVREEEAREMCNYEYDFGVVRFSRGMFHFDRIKENAPYSYEDWFILANHDYDLIEIVGNCYENPELISYYKKF